jgi:inosine-uridine nucleoside N-ribohydrolase
MLLVEPELIVGSRQARVRVETASDLTRGYSLVDDRPERGAPNARVIDAVDSEGFYRSYCRLLSA